MWFKQFKRYFWQIEKFAYGEINERSFSNRHPRLALTKETRYLVRKGVTYTKKNDRDISRAHCIVMKFQSRKILL